MNRMYLIQKILNILPKKNISKDASVVKLNQNRVKLGDIVFVNMTNISYGNYVGKIKGMREGTKVIVFKADGRTLQSVFINRCNHANESQRKEYFKDVLKHG